MGRSYDSELLQIKEPGDSQWLEEADEDVMRA